MKSKVYLDLKQTTYKYMYKGLIFYFSSKFYMNKFINNVDEFIKYENLKIETKYKLNIALELYLSIAFYKRIEKRGFRVKDDVNKQELKDNLLMGSMFICRN